MADEYLTNWQGAVNDQAAFGKNAYLEAIPDLAYSIDAAKGIGGLQTRAAMDQTALANGLAQRRTKFDGMEDQYATDAMGYNSEGRKEAAASGAAADVESSFAGMRNQTGRQAERAGVNPGSGKFIAAQGQIGVQEAAAKAGAANKARQDVDAIADGKQKAAIAMGSNLSSEATAAAQAAAYTGNSAIAAAAKPLTDRLAFAGGVSNVYGSEISGNKDLWGTSNLTAAQKANLDVNSAAVSAQEDGNMWGALGSIAGAASSSPSIISAASNLFK